MTADCSPSWTSQLIRTYFSSKLFFFMPESKLYTQPIALLLKKIYGLGRFRRFRGLLIHSFVTPKNMEKSSQNFGDQPLKIQIVQVLFERSDLIPDSFAETFFFLDSTFYILFIRLQFGCANNPFKKNFPKDIPEGISYP